MLDDWVNVRKLSCIIYTYFYFNVYLSIYLLGEEGVVVLVDRWITEENILSNYSMFSFLIVIDIFGGGVLFEYRKYLNIFRFFKLCIVFIFG